MEVNITSENFETLKNGDMPLVVDFWATWCGPCRMVGPIISQLADEYDGRIVVGKCDVEEADDIAAEMGIRNIPTIMFFKNGQLVDKFVGATTKANLQQKFGKKGPQSHIKARALNMLVNTLSLKKERPARVLKVRSEKG